ncbi:MAG: putative L,D-transpeptidase YkuD [candidate division BRC1 bacterium ADurb.BinA364]|nr:MAG: putative L,D-transpeptidase YkuD [candidate division BRC1 bacterium ADurb.BinA364]
MRIKTFIFLLMFAGVVAVLAVGAGYFSAQKRQKKIAELIHLAESSLDSGQYQAALEAASEVIERYGARPELDRLHYIRARSYEALGKTEQALGQWQAIRRDFPGSPFEAEALSALAWKEMEKGGQAGFAAAYDLFREIEQRFPESPAYKGALFGFAKIDLADGNTMSARDTLLRLMDEAPDFPQRAEAEAILSDINTKLLYSPTPLEGEEIYEVRKGDTLDSIGRRFRVSYDLIMKVNKIANPLTLSIGRKLKIPNLSFSIVVDVGDNTLTLLNHGKFFKKYPVRTGMEEGQTPLGDFSITLKQKDPPWYHEGRIIPAGDPANELGTRWMAFSGAQYGIHGTIDPSTIGKYSSQGCIGMLKDDVEELFDLVPVGTPVKIVGKRKTDKDTKNERP